MRYYYGIAKEYTMKVQVFKSEFGEGGIAIRVIVDKYNNRIVIQEDLTVITMDAGEFSAYTIEAQFSFIEEKEV